MRTVIPPASYSLVTDGDVALGGFIFKGGAPLLHTDGTGNTALGLNALEASTTSGNNTAVGFRALTSSTSGSFNVATGYSALRNNESGRGNVAVGSTSLFSSNTGSYNVAVGFGALVFSNGEHNVALGARAGYWAETGSDNIFIGRRAGYWVETGSNNIFIGHEGSISNPGDSQTIRIGTPGTHVTARIAGDLGLGSVIPTNRLHVVEAISGSTLANHVAAIENTLDNTNADALAIKINVLAPTASNNFVTFYTRDNTIAGEIEGDSAGGVVYGSSNADYAEWLQRLDADEVLEPGDVVGLFGDRVSKSTLGADGVMVVSTGPIVAGNDPGEESRGDYARVAFVGQVDTKVEGVVHRGDYLVPAGDGDGKAVAVSPEDLDAQSLRRVLGRALADRQPTDPETVRTLVGVADPGPLAAVLTGQTETIESLQRELTRQGLELAELRDRVRTLPVLEAKR